MSGYVFPIQGGVITSPFGGRASPGGIGSTNHGGLDIGIGGNVIGTPIQATIGGEVTNVGRMGGFGNVVEIRGTDGNLHRYAHLNSANVQPGQVVSPGQHIGGMGNTGRSTAAHLHYEVRDAANRLLNPGRLLDGAKQAAGDLLDDARRSLGPAAAAVANTVLPGSGAVLDGLGITSECGWLCQLKEWIADSGFFPRLALAILAFIIIAGALFLLGKGTVVSQATKALKG